MDYKYFKHVHSDLDSTTLKPVHEVVGLYRINEVLDAEFFKGSNIWVPDEGNFVVEAFLGIDWVTEYDQITEAEAEVLKYQLFPEAG